jgi:hypothetical protein
LSEVSRFTLRPVPMRPTVVIASALPVVAALAACGGTLWPTTKIQIKSYAPDVFACVQATATDLGYHSTLSDTLHRVYEGRRESKQKSFVEVDEFSAADRLKIKVDAPKKVGGDASSLAIQAQSVSVHETKEGVIEEPEPASGRVLQDAKAIVSKCAPSSTPATS